MYKVKGRVLVHETGAPVPNVIVAAFDIDSAPRRESSTVTGAERLGSAATDLHGAFAIEFTAREFGDSSSREFRPDIKLEVHGPDVAGSEADDAKPLYIMPRVRSDAGREEGFIIFLPAKLLRERNIPSWQGASQIEELDTSIRRRLEERAKGIEMVRGALRPELKRRTSLRKEARKEIRRLLGQSRKGGLAGRFVPSNTDPTISLKSARTAGLKRLASIQQSGMTVRATPELINRLGLKPSEDGRTIAEKKTFSADIYEQNLAPQMIVPTRRIDPLLLCRATQRVNDFKRNAEAHSDADDHMLPPPGGDMSRLPGGPEEVNPDANASIQKALRDTISSLQWTSGSPIGSRPSADVIAGDLKRELKGGPGDSPALHDFHHLQIAWDNIWTAIVDENLVGDMAELYNKVVEVVDWPESEPDLSEVTELEQFLVNLEEAIQTAAGIDEDIGGVQKAPELFGWLPELAAKWDIIGTFQQERMGFLYWIDQYAWPKSAKDIGYQLVLKNYVEFFEPNFSLDQWAPLEKLWEIGQVHPEWLEIKVNTLHSGWGRDQALSILNQYQAVPGQEGVSTPVIPSVSLGRAKRFLETIQKSLGEPYAFKVFSPNSHNFGIIVTYRQRWEPLAYQAGEMVGTIPLAPGEKRSYTKKRILKISRAQKEIEKSLASRTGESSQTTRAEAEIVNKAAYSTNFKMTVHGGFNVGVANADAGAEYGTNQQIESSQKKQDFREAVRKAAQEFRNERTVEISTEKVSTDEFTETAEIENENNELTVTYLFYELQRRFEVSERLQRITPVILFAFDVPPPSEIDEAWLLAHEWILRRVILDDGLLPALDYLTDAFAGDELGVEVHRVNWQTQINVVKELHETADLHTQARKVARNALKRAYEAVGSFGGGGLFDKVGDALFGDDDQSKTEAAEARRQAAQKALEWAEADMAAAGERLTAAINSLQESTNAYGEALQRRLNRRTAIDQLRMHVKGNILYYMQAIWLHEPSDQRYLRVYDKEIEWPEIQEPYYTAVPFNPQWLGLPDGNTIWFKVLMPGAVLANTRKLHEVADVDNLLGFKGNYAIFPLKQISAVTSYMMQSYLDSYFELRDPDPFGEMPAPTEALDIAECAWNSAATTEEDKARITEWLTNVLNNQRHTSEEIVVPTSHLFVEALPGSHPILEDFKLKHRQVDVERATAEAIQKKLEALRYAARINAGQLGDPEIQTQVTVPSGAAINVNAGGGTGPA